MTNEPYFEFAGIVSHDPDQDETVLLYRRRIDATRDEFRHVVIDSTTDARVVEFPGTPDEKMNVTAGHEGTDE